MVTDQVLDGRVLDLRGVKVHAAVRVPQGPVAPRVALRCFKDVGKKGGDKWMAVALVYGALSVLSSHACEIPIQYIYYNKYIYFCSSTIYHTIYILLLPLTPENRATGAKGSRHRTTMSTGRRAVGWTVYFIASCYLNDLQ